MSEISLVIGTAGHIDHGKTTLIKALTGVDCDRLQEEKKRGITIELGFAPLKLDDGRIISVIDVPGHEKFIRQMVAGASGIDAALLVIAADESIMPQTREHVAIMELLGVHDGLIAVTKIDRVKDEAGMIDLVLDDVKNFVKGTFLEGKKIIPVSPITGENLEALKFEISELINRVKPRPRDGALFLPVDRAFPISGFGTVITGTAYKGTAKAGDKIEILPSSNEGRIRTLQVHGQNVNEAFAGQRVAANLIGISLDDIKRGDVVCKKDVYKNTRCLDVIIKVLPEVKEPLKHWQRVHICIGTSEILGRVSLLKSKQISPGNFEPVQLVLEEPIVCTSGQHFIIRFYSPLTTIGGGVVIFPYSYKPRGAKSRAKILERIENLRSAGNTEGRLEYLVKEAGKLKISDAVFLTQTENLKPFAEPLIKSGKIIELDGEYLSPDFCDGILENLKISVMDYQKKFPSEKGLPVELVPFPRALINLAVERKLLKLDENKLHTPDFVPESSEEFLKNKNSLLEICRLRKWQLISKSELQNEMQIPQKIFNDLLQSMRNSKELALLSGEFIFIIELENEMLKILNGLGSPITLAQVRDATNSTRKFILPILEYFDSKGYTRRAGDMRVIMRKTTD